MKIFLLGYMGSGKTTVGKMLSNDMELEFFDLDQQIEKEEGKKISELFAEKGEVFFRKKERKVLEDVLNSERELLVSLGGGTPCYGNNLEIIKANPENKTVYLKYSISYLLDRLWNERSGRPMISHLNDKEKLEEFIRKHLFERGFYYNQSEIIINCDEKSPEEIGSEIEERLS